MRDSLINPREFKWILERQKLQNHFICRLFMFFFSGVEITILWITNAVPSSFWAQWTVFEYDKRLSHKIQFAPVFASWQGIFNWAGEKRWHQTADERERVWWKELSCFAWNLHKISSRKNQSILGERLVKGSFSSDYILLQILGS